MEDILLRRKKTQVKGAGQGLGAEHPDGATARSPAFPTPASTSVKQNKRKLGARASIPEQQLDRCNSHGVLGDMPVDSDRFAKDAAASRMFKLAG